MTAVVEFERGGGSVCEGAVVIAGNRGTFSKAAFRGHFDEKGTEKKC